MVLWNRLASNMTDNFVHLHNHSMASLLDGFSSPEEMVDRVSEIEQTAIALTDHGTMSAMLQFYQYAISKNIKPIIGIEAYLTEDRFIKDKEDHIYHICLLAKNSEGLHNLYKLSDLAWNQGFYKKPRIDFAALNDFGEGIICLSGCLNGIVAYHLGLGNTNDAHRFNDKLYNIFRENYFIELQPWNTKELNEYLIDIASNDIPLVVTADTHYAREEDKVAEEINLIIAQTSEFTSKNKDIVYSKYNSSKKISDPLKRINYLHPDRKLRYDNIDNYLMTRKNIEKRMKDLGIDRSDIYDNTLVIADMCSIEIPFNQDYFPIFSKSFDSDDFLWELAFDALEFKELSKNQEYVNRLEDELEVVKRLRFSDYFLVIWDMIRYSQSKGILVGPGRGSVGGSLLAYVLGITRIDPIQHDLLFWRFLNIELEYNPKFEVLA